MFYDLILTGLRTFLPPYTEDNATQLYPSPLSLQIIPILQDPHVVSHPAAALAADVIWFRFAVFYFLRGVVYGAVQVIRIGVVGGIFGCSQFIFFNENLRDENHRPNANSPAKNEGLSWDCSGTMVVKNPLRP